MIRRGLAGNSQAAGAIGRDRFSPARWLASAGTEPRLASLDRPLLLCQLC